MQRTTRKIAAAGVLSVLSVLLGVTSLGYVPLPGIPAAASITGVPVYIGSVLEGWPVGCLVGLVSGLTSFTQSALPLFTDPLVSIVPRILVGLTPYLACRALKNRHRVLAYGVAGAVGSLSNTVLVVAVILLRGYATLPEMLTVIPQAIGEMVLSVVLTTAVCATWQRVTVGPGRPRLSEGA